MHEAFGSFGKVPIEEIRKRLEARIKELESETSPKHSKTELAKLYLEYSFVSKGQETIVYAHKAISIDPTVEVSQQVIMPGGEKKMFGEERKNDVHSLKTNYLMSRTPEHVRALENFLSGIKQEAREKGPQALIEHEKLYDMITKKSIIDPIIFSEEAAELTDSELRAAQHGNARKDLGVNSFLSDMILSAEEDRRDRKRWKEGGKLPEASFEQLAKIFSPYYPRHVIINKDALGGIKTEETRKFGAIDDVCDEIFLEVAKRLPRRLDAYRLKHKYAKEEIEIKGIGKIKVLIHGDGVFTHISSIDSDMFNISNCRTTGRSYLEKNNDISLPNKITIKPLDILVELYEDRSGIHITEKEREYTNNRCDAFGTGYFGDEYRDQMYKKGRKLKISDSSSIFKKLFDALAPDKSWKKENQRISKWLRDNILKKITESSVYENQATSMPNPIPYPSNIGTLYSWITVKNSEKIELTNGDRERLYPDERAILTPNRRLVPIGTRGQFPEEAYDGFVWCGIGKPIPNSSPDKYIIPGHYMDSELMDYRNKLLEINPANGDEVYLIDYHIWDELEKAYTSPKGISDNEATKLHEAFVKTLIPINKYKGDYKKPVVLIGRDIEMGEAKIVPGIIYKG